MGVGVGGSGVAVGGIGVGLGRAVAVGIGAESGVTLSDVIAEREGVGVGAATARATEDGCVGTAVGCTGEAGADDALGFSPRDPARPSNSSLPRTQPPAAASAMSNSRSSMLPTPLPLEWSLCQPCCAIPLRRSP